MIQFVQNLSDRLRAGIDRYKNKDFLEAAMAASALVATADKKVTFSERMKIDQILETITKLRIYDPHVAVDLFNEFVDQIGADENHGRDNAIQRIKDISEEKGQAQIIVEICVAVSLADGALMPKEKDEINLVCEALGVTPPDIVELYEET